MVVQKLSMRGYDEREREGGREREGERKGGRERERGGEDGEEREREGGREGGRESTHSPSMDEMPAC